MTREQLDAIRARVEAATPGPWEAGTAFCCPDMGWIDGPRRMVCPVHESAKRTHTLNANDAEFIAHAREDVPAIVAEVERLEARVFVLENAMVSIERRLREDAAPLVALVNAHGGPAERKAWKSVYSSAITAQIVGPTGPTLPKELEE